MRKVILACVVALMCFSCNDDKDSSVARVSAHDISVKADDQGLTPLDVASREGDI